jgi:hypothetical protein
MNLALGITGEFNGIGNYLFCNNNPLIYTDPLGLEWSMAWHWHHVLTKEVFVGTKAAPSYISELGLTLAEGIDVDAPEYGRLLRGKEHIGKGGVHASGYNYELKQKLLEFRRTNPKVRILQNNHIAEILDSVDPKFKKFNEIGQKTYVSYSVWDKAKHKLLANRFARERIRGLRSGAATGKGKAQKGRAGGKLRSFVGPLGLLSQGAGLLADELEAREYREALILQHTVRGDSMERIEKMLEVRRTLEIQSIEFDPVMGLPNPNYDPSVERYLHSIPEDRILTESWFIDLRLGT